VKKQEESPDGLLLFKLMFKPNPLIIFPIPFQHLSHHLPLNFHKAAEAFAHMSISVGERVANLFGIRAGDGAAAGGSADSSATGNNNNKSSSSGGGVTSASHDRTPRTSIGGNAPDLDNSIHVRTSMDEEEADWGSKSDVNGSVEDVVNMNTNTSGSTVAIDASSTTSSESGSNTEQLKHMETPGTIRTDTTTKDSDTPVVSEGPSHISVEGTKGLGSIIMTSSQSLTTIGAVPKSSNED